MFLPVTKGEMDALGWDQPDFIIVTGDAYIDHHSYGTAIIGRHLESFGYKVGVIPQPDVSSLDDFQRLGRPRLGFLVNSGVVDSMVNNYSVAKRKRSRDEYSPGGKAGQRPDRALIVYCNRIRQAFGEAPIIIGGIEASLRRFAHYDYWDNRVRRSILVDSGADLLIYGMGERAVVEIAEALDSGIHIKHITWVKGTTYRTKEVDEGWETAYLPDFKEVASDKVAYCKSFKMKYENTDYVNGLRLVEPCDGFYVVQNPPQPPLEREELDRVYQLPYENRPHPIYDGLGDIPAFQEVKFSVVSSRGCFGGCSFCAITYHQGRQVRSRSKEAIVSEVKEMVKRPGFKGYVHDVGGPTANFRQPSCTKQLTKGVCKDKDCLWPKVCPAIKAEHQEYMEILRELRQLEGIKKVFIRSGIRYDYLLADPKADEIIEEICNHHVSGILKVAPEHTSPAVLAHMRKPSIELFEDFVKRYFKANEKIGKKQYLIPYFISSHPGSTLDDAIDLALFLKNFGFVPDQVQDFYPTPGTLATCMYYTGMDPFTLKKVYVAKNPEEKAMQRALIHFHKHENKRLVHKALAITGRQRDGDILFGKRKDVKNGTAQFEKRHRGRSDHGQAVNSRSESSSSSSKAKHRRPKSTRENKHRQRNI